jgi:hypothetical protein
MDVFTSLMTPGYLVRTSKHHGVVEEFNTTTNMVTVWLPEPRERRDYHVTQLRAGNAESAIAVMGRGALAAGVFPYCARRLSISTNARSIPHVGNSRLDDDGVVGA